MFIVKIAGLKIAINNKFGFVEQQCLSYIYNGADFDFLVEATLEEIEKEKKLSETDFSEGYLESICIYRNIAKVLPVHNAFVMHCAAVEYDGNAYCFAARSGTGKTTHIKLWRRFIGDNIHIINGDKPVMRFINGELHAFGSPWCGKENFGKNTSAPVKGICFLKQNTENYIEKINSFDALGLLLKQVYIPENINNSAKTVDYISDIINNIPIWMLNCNISEEAAKLSFNTMCFKDNNANQ